MKELRLKHGWSQEQLGGKANVKAQAISRFEHTGNGISNRALRRIAPLLGLREIQWWLLWEYRTEREGFDLKDFADRVGARPSGVENGAGVKV